MSITVNENGVMEYVRESQEGIIIVDRVTNYDNAYKDFWNVYEIS